MRVGAWLIAASGVGLLLCGCDGGSSPKVVAPVPGDLAGNWLVVGPMPASAPDASTGFRLALTVDVTGNNLVATGFGDTSCGSVGSPAAFGSVVTGTVAADGSFTLQAPSIFPGAAISITGAVPKTAGGAWSGSYTGSFASSFGPPCSATYAGMLAATSFPLVSGVYVGTGSSQTSTNGVVTTTPITFQVTLQQGGTVTVPATGKPVTSNSVLIGSIRVQGSPCFSSGVTSSTLSSAVEGNELVAEFTMDDGSTLSIIGTLTDPTETRITTTTGVVLIESGRCSTIPTVYQLSELDRQS
jgi:hypothetical protein